MGGRYSLGDSSILMRRFGLEEFAETTITPHFNVAPSQGIPPWCNSLTTRASWYGKWGFVPFFKERERN